MAMLISPSPLPLMSDMHAVFPDTDEARLREDFFRDARKGFFVDVGAFKPVEGSQTWALEQLGWDGVLIEPQPELAERLRSDRRVPVYAVACSSRRNSGKTMPLHIAGGMHASLEPDYYVAGYRRRELATIEVPIKTIDDILGEVHAPVPIDFISIDVEFHEIEVLDGFDIQHWGPRLILIEDVPADLRIHRYLRRRGYKWVRRTGLNSWYVPEQMPMPVSLFGRWQFVRKHILAVPFRRSREAKRRWRHQ
jgi:FkbM family methyltransferase